MMQVRIKKKFVFFPALLFSLIFAFPTFSFAQDNHTASEEAKGKEVWEKLQTKNLNCEDLTEDDFGSLGEYFMRQMLALNRSAASGLGAGEQHETMNNMMIQMMGGEGEKQMHVAMGKRMSGCQSNAVMPQDMMTGGMMPMMMSSLMKGGGSSMMGPGSNLTGMMENTWGGSWLFGIHSFLALITWLALIAFLLSAARYFWRKK